MLDCYLESEPKWNIFKINLFSWQSHKKAILIIKKMLNTLIIWDTFLNFISESKEKCLRKDSITHSGGMSN